MNNLGKFLDEQPLTPHVTVVTDNYKSGNRLMFTVAYRINMVPLGAFHVSSNGLFHADYHVIAKDSNNNWHIFFESTLTDAATTTYSEVRKCLKRFVESLNTNMDLLKQLQTAAACDFLRHI